MDRESLLPEQFTSRMKLQCYDSAWQALGQGLAAAACAFILQDVFSVSGGVRSPRLVEMQSGIFCTNGAAVSTIPERHVTRRRCSRASFGTIQKSGTIRFSKHPFEYPVRLVAGGY